MTSLKSSSVRSFLFVILFILITSVSAMAQTGDGTLVGNVTDEQQAVLPGVAITATSPSLQGQRSVISDERGYFRLLNLPPGEYTVTAELAGFATYKRTGIAVRAGATFTVNVALQVTALAQEVTVTAESPMVETASAATNVLIQGEFQREIPLQGRRNWSDMLEMIPGLNARPFDDNSGRMVYYGRGAHHWSQVIKVDGANAASYYDAQVTFINMSTDTIGDVEMKAGGLEASAEMGNSVNVNIVTPSGGNQLHGSATSTLQGKGDFWNDAKAQIAKVGGGTPTVQQVFLYDFSLGGPIRKDKIWFFASARHNRLENGISRTPQNLFYLQAFDPKFQVYDNRNQSTQYYVKGTTQIGTKHNFLVSFSDDTVNFSQNREYNIHQVRWASTGGRMIVNKLNTLWTNEFNTSFMFAYNNKSGNNPHTYDKMLKIVPGGPQIRVHQAAILNSGVLTGTGLLVDMNNADLLEFQPASRMEIKADFAYFKQGWKGSHGLQWGFYAEPRLTYDTRTEYVNNGFSLEEVRLRNPNNPQAGVIPFHRQIRTPSTVAGFKARERDVAFYVQDAWRPTQRLTMNVGLRTDWVRRDDKIYNITRQKSRAIAPRFGFTYMLDRDGKNVIRASAGRQHYTLTGRDAPTRYLGAAGSQSIRDTYDLDANGTFETEIVTQTTTSAIAKLQFDPKLHQPYTDEFIIGYRRQFPWQFSIDIAGVQKQVKHVYQEIEINGFYPAGPNLPFIGFGRIDPTRGAIYQQTNSTWNRMNLQALEIIVTKNMAHGFMFMGTGSRQRHWFTGDWSPTSPARFIYPGQFKGHTHLYDTRGNNESTLPIGGGSVWGAYSISLAGVWEAPWGIVINSSYTQHEGEASGALVRQATTEERAVFGPARVTVQGGGQQSNPLAIGTRYSSAAGMDNQLILPAPKNLNWKIGRKFKFTESQTLEVGLNILNSLNGARFYQYAGSANQIYSANYAEKRNQQPPRAYQVMLQYKF